MRRKINKIEVWGWSGQYINAVEELHLHYPTVADLQEHTKTASTVNYNIRNAYLIDHMDRGTDSWLGCSSFAMVDDLVCKGWPEGLKRVQSNMREINVPAPTSVKRRKIRDRFGDELDIHAVYAGNLDRAWTRTTRYPISSIREVTLYVDAGAPGHVSSDRLFWRGAAAVIACDALEGAGYSVKVVVYRRSSEAYHASGKPSRLLITVAVKDSGQPLNKSLLVSATALSGFYRKYLFLAQLTEDTLADEMFGSTETWDPQPEGSNELVFNIGKISTKEEAQKTVDGIVGKLEGEFDR